MQETKSCMWQLGAPDQEKRQNAETAGLEFDAPQARPDGRGAGQL